MIFLGFIQSPAYSQEAPLSLVVDAAQPSKVSDPKLVLKPGDTVEIVVRGEEDLSDDYVIGSQGYVAFPLIGDIRVSGFKVAEAADVIADKLSQGYLKDPYVRVSLVSQSLSEDVFYIVGEVKRPGSYVYTQDMRIEDAVDMAGGFTAHADIFKVFVLKPQREAPDVYKNFMVNEAIEPGVVILVKEKLF